MRPYPGYQRFFSLAVGIFGAGAKAATSLAITTNEAIDVCLCEY